MRIVTSEEMRRIDRFAVSKIGIPAGVLMELAGRSVFEEIARREGGVKGKRFGVICGNGNNGGDGFVVARYLLLHGASVDLWIVGEGTFGPGAARNFLKVVGKIGMTPEWVRTPSDLGKRSRAFRSWDIVVDALFGTGLSRPLRGVQADVVEAMNRFRGPVYAVDLPSGLDSDTGEVLGAAVDATVTVTFGFKKRGLFLGEGPLLAGEVVVADLSFSDDWLDRLDAARLFETDGEETTGWFPARRPDAHKGNSGHVLIVAGSVQKSGAAVLAAKGALRAGAGLVTLAVPRSAHAIVKSQLVEVMTEPLSDDGDGGLGESAIDDLLRISEGKSVLVAGPGLLPTSGLESLLHHLFHSIPIPVVLDADGLNAFGRRITTIGPPLKRMVLTPHPGEMARLTGKSNREVQSSRLETARELSDRTGSVVVLKGAHTVTALPGGDTYVNPTGNPAMATAGMGDVLSGILGSFVAQGLPPGRAAVAGAYYHGLAGDRVARRKGSRGLLASDLIDELPSLSI